MKEQYVFYSTCQIFGETREFHLKKNSREVQRLFFFKHTYSFNKSVKKLVFWVLKTFGRPLWGCVYSFLSTVFGSGNLVYFQSTQAFFGLVSCAPGIEGRCQGRKADGRHLCGGLMSRRTEHEVWWSVQELFRSVLRVHRGLLGPFARKVRKDFMILLS